MKKRIFAILLALVMLLGVLPVTAMAAGSPGYISNVTLGENRSNGGATLLSQWLTYSSLNVAWPSRSGAMQKNVGDTGLTQMMSQAGNYIAAYYGIPAKGSVYSSDTSMIKNCKFELGNYGSTSDPCLNFTYTVAGEGTADITLKYYYSFDGSNWYIGQATFTIYTEGFKPEKPDPPTDDDLEHFWHYNPYSGHDEAVFLWCQRVYNHSGSFSRLTDVPGAYTIYEVTENDGSLLTHPNYKVYTPSVYPWMCRVTLDLQKYLDVYNAVYTNTHYLAEGQERYFNLVLFSDGNKWYTVWDSTITAYITCTQPTTEDITLSYADTHGDPITGLPDAVTRTVAHGEKASFTVAAGPTCDENKHTFASWNTMPDGSGDSYAPGATIELSASATLYAQWNDSGSGDNDNNPETPVGPGEGESDSGNVDFGSNQIIVKCVTPKSAEDPTPVHDLLLSPIEKSTIVPGSGKMDETAGTGSIDVYVTSYVEKYVKENGAHTKKLAADTVTIPLTWNATTQKWNVPVNTNTTVEVVCETTNPPMDPSPAGPTDNDVEGLLNGRTVRVRCATDNTLHTELGYVAKNGLTGGPAKLEGGYTRGEKTYTAYTITLDTGTFVTLYSGTAPTGTGVAHTRNTAQTGETLTWYIYWDGSDWALDTRDEEIVYAVHSTEPETTSYTVHYYLENSTTKVAADKVVNNVNAGSEVTEDAISVTGYTAAAPTRQKLNLSATGTNEIIFYYTKNVGTQVAYTIRYLKEGTGEALLPAYSGTGVAGNSLTVTAPAIDGYTALAPTSYTITLNAEAAENIITFYYREATSTIPAGEPAKEPFNKNANPRQLNRDDHFAYIKGYPDGTVRPEASLTRAEAAAILYRVMEKSCVERFHAESSSFRDVPDGKWYTTYVATLEKAGVIVDSKDGNFRPNDAITRAELASMLAQFANVTGGTNTFSDVPATHWAADYIAAAVRSGWIQGYPDGTFRPEQTIKRAEMTAMVNRALGRDPQSASDLLEGMKTWKDNADPTAWFYLDIQEAANGHTYARKTGGEYWTGLVADVVQ